MRQWNEEDGAAAAVPATATAPAHVDDDVAAAAASVARGSEADTATANSCDDPLGPIPCAPEQKKQTSNSRKSDRQKRKRKGGFVPMERSDFRKTFGSGSLIDGSARTCLPDAIKLMLFWVGVVVTWQSTRKAMPSGRSEDDDPDVDMANIFLKARGYKAELRPAMASNPLAVWRQKSGIFLLEMSLGDLKHFAVYSAAECTVHDNQEGSLPGRVGDSDCVDKTAAIGVFDRIWHRVSAKKVMVNAYELVRL